MATRKECAITLLAAVLASGCVAVPARGTMDASDPPEPVNEAPASGVQPAAHHGLPQETELVQPIAVAETVDAEPIEHAVDESLSLATLESMALSSNPAISQAAARVRALRGRWVQVGLAPNPTAGYTSSDVGNEGSSGQQGGFVGQEFVTANKLGRNRAVAAAEISRAEQLLVAAQRRVQTDVRQAYYDALVAQKRVDLTEEIVRLTSESVDASKSLLEANEIAVAALLQTEIVEQNALIVQQTATNRLAQAWRQLSAVIGGTQLPIQPLEGDPSQLPGLPAWEEQLLRLQSESPEVASAVAGIERARRALNRACVEAVPNVTTQVSVQYDDLTEDTIAGVQIGMPLPIWNRNQGGIRQAQAEVTESIRNLERVELNLNRRLADAFRQYSDAYVSARAYSADILPRSERTLSLVQAAYAQGEIGYLDLLAAQRAYSQTNLAYLDAIQSLWRSHLLIDGLMLEGSLE